MKSTKNTKNLKSRVVSLVAVIALILCTVLSFYIIVPSLAANADDDTTVAARRSNNGIRFVQVATGADFAIGLTNDRRLFGWSLIKDRGEAPAPVVNTLGDFYTETPTEIDVKFRNGPGESGTYDWGTSGTTEYHEIINTDRIKAIAATRYVAAFITEKGYIYTWGKDDSTVYDVSGGGLNNYLLLREVGTNYSWTTPYIINYHYYGTSNAFSTDTTDVNCSPLEQLIPGVGGTDTSAASIAAGEYNFIFLFERNYARNASWEDKAAGKYFYAFVWGSRMYEVSHNMPEPTHSYESIEITNSDGDGGYKLFNTFVSSRSGDNSALNTNVSVAAGGYTVAINNTGAGVSGGTSLQIRGRNFLTSQPLTADGEDATKLTPTYTTEVLTTQDAPAVGDIVYKTYNVLGAVAGSNSDRSSSVSKNLGTLAGYDTEQYYARQKQSLDNDAGRYSVVSAGALIGSDGKVIENTLAPTHYAVSLGNDIGYGISGGKLYAWGDNAAGQLTNAVSRKYSSNPTNILAGKTVISVAAGKQLSQEKAFFGSQETLNSDLSFINTNDRSVKNKTEFISAALDNNGTVWAWSENIQEPQPLNYNNINTGNKKENYAAVYSGYDENLFAVTVSGKLVRITVKKGGTEEAPTYTFDQKIYDTFKDSNGQTINNYVVDDSNVVAFSFNPDDQNKYDPTLGSATFYVWGATVGENGLTALNGEGGYRSLIKENNIGDAYRIIGFNADDAGIEYINAGKLTAYAPVYKFDGNVMSEEQRKNMFACSMVPGEDGKAVGISIVPLKSSKGKNITIEFYIARYNNYSKYRASVSGTQEDPVNTSTDDAIYYDYAPCKITFSIADTPSVQQFEAFTGGENNRLCSIPLLDPNNEFNNAYSLAVQDVSSGIDALLAFLSARNTTVSKADILSDIRTKDKGFPDSEKLVKGNLTYYLNDTDQARFNDAYDYLFKDRDSDRIEIGRPGNEGQGDLMGGAGATAVEGLPTDVTVRVAWTSAYQDGNLFYNKTPAEISKIISTDFDNTFGLYDIACVSEDDKLYLTFKYSVLTFTAKGSTGTVPYSGDGVDSYRLTETGERAIASISARTLNNYNYSADSGYVVNNNSKVNININLRIASIFSQPTLRLKPDINAQQKIYYDGKAGGGKNTYTETCNGTVGETVTIRLSTYLSYMTSSMSFSYGNSSSEFEGFNSQFQDYSGQGLKVVTLDGDQITVHITTAAPIKFTVEAQRFSDPGKTKPFKSGDNVDEKIYMTFSFNPIADFTLTKSQTAITTYLVTKETSISLFGDGNATTLGNAGYSFIDITCNTNVRQTLTDSAKMYGVLFSEGNKTDKVFDCIPAQDGKSIVIRPIKSGSGIVQFSVNVYGKSLSFTLTINVSYITTLSETITVIDDQYVYISDLTAALKDSNSFNAGVNNDEYKILMNDVKNPEARPADQLYNAIYFTDSAGNPLGDGNRPSFIKNAVFENKDSDAPYIRLITSNSSMQQSSTYYMHVKFTNAANASDYANAPEGSVIEIIVPIVSGKVKLQKDGADFVVKINCRDTAQTSDAYQFVTITGSGIDTRVVIDLKPLLEMDDGIGAPERWRISLLSADVSATEYFQYEKENKTIVITPNDNTPDTFEINVSVYHESDRTIAGRVVSFGVEVSGIVTTLPVMTEDGIIGYGNIWLYSLAIVFGVLLIIFIIRFIVYIRRRSKQRAIIKRNQELIRMRDRMHGKANSATREQLVRSKMKMDDPKYAKMFNDMRRDKEDESGISLENSDLAATAERKTKKKKKKGGKKSVAELKAELEAKKAAFAAAQAQNDQPVNPFAQDIPIDGNGFGVPGDPGFGGDAGFGGDPGFGGDAGFAPGGADGGEIIFDASDLGDGNM